MELLAPAGYTARPPTYDDAPAIAALVDACQRGDGDEDRVSAEDILADWEGVDLVSEARVITTTGGELAASVDVDNRGYVTIAVYGYVDPAHGGRGLGTALVAWGEAWALAHLGHSPAGARVRTQHYIPAPNVAARRLLEGLGYRPERTVYKMLISLEGTPAFPEMLGEVVLRDFVPGRDERGTFDTMEEAFRDHWGSVPHQFERWLELTRGERGDPECWHLAVQRESGQIVGTCLGRAAGGQGWIGGVGVLPAWRRRGIAGALLRRSFASFHRRGIRDVGLSVDSESLTGAPGIYLDAGMHVSQRYLVYRKTLRPGEDLSVTGDA